MNFRRTLTFVCVLLSASAVVAAQRALKVDVDLVTFNVSVTDDENRPIKDLQPENFQIFEDKIEQKIQYFSSESAPVSIGIVLDLSHSMQKKLSFARDAALKFLETGTPEDEYFLVEFAMLAKLADRFTADINRIRSG